MGRYFIISGLPAQRAKDARIDSRVKAACTQAKPAS
jgi:hypothetical protein